MQPLRHSISFLFRIRYFPTLRLFSSNAPKSLPHANPHHKQSSLFILFFPSPFRSAVGMYDFVITNEKSILSIQTILLSIRIHSFHIYG